MLLTLFCWKSIELILSLVVVTMKLCLQLTIKLRCCGISFFFLSFSLFSE